MLELLCEVSVLNVSYLTWFGLAVGPSFGVVTPDYRSESGGSAGGRLHKNGNVSS